MGTDKGRVSRTGRLDPHWRSAGRYVPTEFNEPRVRKGITELVPIPGQAFVPNPLPPRHLERDAVVGRLYQFVENAHVPLLRLEGLLSELPNPLVLLRALRKREVQQSSTIENTIASIDEISRLEAGMASDRHEVLEVRNNLRAVEFALSSPLPLSNRLLREAHGILLEETRGDGETPGDFRTTQACIGDQTRGFSNARFVPPPPGDELLRCLDDFERYLNADSFPKQISPRYPWLVELAFAHYQFEAIHPFRDGNGRLGRLLVNVSPVKSGHLKFPLVNISEYFATHRERYYDTLLAVSVSGSWEAWAREFCIAVATQAAADLVRARALNSLRSRYFAIFSSKRNSVLTHKLIDLLFTRLFVTARQVTENLDVTVPTAQKHLNLLLARGIASEVTGGSINRVYSAPDILRIVNAPIHELDHEDND